ncbi:MAG: amino acid permease, partial [Chloroflexi bacterium]|nr:amino acid permease [Chloroflexota bacterium]
NTGARVTYAMGRDEDSPIPSNLGILHGKTLTPYKSMWVLAILTMVIGAYGAYFAMAGSAAPTDVKDSLHYLANYPNGLLLITYLSNFGTFALYGMTCVLTIMAFWKSEEKNVLKHVVVPFLGAALNFYLMFAYIGMGPEAKDAFYAAVAFAVIGLGFMFAWSKASGVSVLHKGEVAMSTP